MSAQHHDSQCPSCQSRRQFLGSGLILGLGLVLPSLSVAGSFKQFNGDILVNGRQATSRTRIHAGSLITTSANSSTSFVSQIHPSRKFACFYFHFTFNYRGIIKCLWAWTQKTDYQHRHHRYSWYWCVYGVAGS